MSLTEAQRAGRPILEAIRALLKFRDTTTIGEIAKMAGVKDRAVLDVINANEGMVWRYRKTGKIMSVDPRGVLNKRLWEGGKYFKAHDLGDDQDPRRDRGGYLDFKGHDAFRTAKQERAALTYGYRDIVRDTPENRAALIAAGCQPWTEIVIDDRLWQEPAGRSALQDEAHDG